MLPFYMRTTDGNSLSTMMTLENNWKQKSIENLEKDFWGPSPKNSTPLVDKVHRLRTIQIETLEPKHIRLLIGQKVGLRFLIPVALEILTPDIFINTDFYNGDLLQNVLNVDNNFWQENKELKERLNGLLDSYSEEDKEKFRKGKFDEWT
jgi:hypothetical protein